jgi:putative ABC transport system permease protein
VKVRVARTVPRKGIGGFEAFGGGSEAPNVFVPLGTLERVAAAIPPQFAAALPTSFVAVSNRGGVIDGEKLTPTVSATLDAAMKGAQIQALRHDSKHDLLEAADANGKQFTQLFFVIGMFSVLAGILLLVNIFVMLAQERKTEMGMLRAVGLRRTSLVGSFSFEGWMYALASSVLGALAGIGLGRIVVFVAAGLFRRNSFGRVLELRFSATALNVQTGLSVGFAISLVTVVLTSLTIARLNVIRAIRDLPEPPQGTDARRRSAVGGAVLAAVGLLMFVSGLTGKAAVPVLLGPSFLCAGAVPLLRSVLPRRLLVSAAASISLGWAIIAFSVVPGAFEDSAIAVFLLQGIILTCAAVALVSQNQDSIGGVIRRVGGGAKNMSLRLGLAYPLAKRFRTSLILGMYSIVVFALTFMTVFSHLFSHQLVDFTRKISAGYDLQAVSNRSNPLSPDAVKAVPGVVDASVVTQTYAEFKAGRLTPDKAAGWPWVATFDQHFTDRGGISLIKREPQYADDAAVYRAVASRPDLIIASRFFLQSSNGPPKGSLHTGDVISMTNPLTGVTRQLTVAGIAESGFGNLNVFVSPSTMQQMFPGELAPTLLYIRSRPGTDPEQLAQTLNGQFVANGVDASSFRHLVGKGASQQEGFMRLMQGYLALGLAVGIAGLGVVMVRAVRERRRQVGVLRSLGFPSVSVRRAFVTESAFVALEGIGIGMVLALVTAWRLIGSGSFGGGLAFSVPVLPLFVLVLGTFIASLLATAAPAQQASRIRPAVALRIAD